MALPSRHVSKYTSTAQKLLLFVVKAHMHKAEQSTGFKKATAWQWQGLMQVICVQNGVSLLGQAGLEVCHYQADIDDYIPVKCSVHPDAITSNLLIFVVS